MTSSSSSTLLSLVSFLLASSSVTRAAGGGGGLKHIHLYMHETITGPNMTLYVAAPPRQPGSDTTFGMVGVLDDELRDGQDPSNSSLVGQFQGLFAFAGLVTPPGMQTAVSARHCRLPHFVEQVVRGRG
jgi:hypothetical protein